MLPRFRRSVLYLYPLYILDSLLAFLSDLQIESLYCYFVQLHCDLRGFTVKILQQPIPPTSHYQYMLCSMGPIVIKAVVLLNAEADTILLDLAGPLTGLRILC